MSSQMAKSYPEIPQVYYHLAKSLLVSNDFRRARENFIKLYWLTSNKSEAKQALMGMAECSLRLKEEDKALQILDNLQEKFSVENSDQFAFLYGRVLLHNGDFSGSAEYLKKVTPRFLEKSQKETLKYYKDWLSLLSPNTKIPFIANGATALELQGGLTVALAAWSKESCHIYQFKQGIPTLMGSLPPKKGVEFTGPLVTADIFGDKDSIIIIGGKSASNSRLLFYRFVNNEFVSEKGAVLGNVSIGALKVGRIIHKTRDNLIVLDKNNGTAKVLFFHRKYKKIKSRSILPEWAGNNEILSIGIADINKGGQSEILIGTGDLEYYDIGVYNYYAKKFSVTMRKRLGKVSGSASADLNQDGIPEILALKTHTNNREIFGEDNPSGEKDGFYIFNNKLELLWQATEEYELESKNIFSSLKVNLLGEVPVAICRYRRQQETFAKQKIEDRIWLIRNYNNEFRQLDFTWKNPIFSFYIGDVDGDEEGELVICGQNGIGIYGIKQH